MDKPAEKGNENYGISLSRNTPVVLVVGAASFLGSHLVDKLLKKNLQVIGVDDLSYGLRQNLSQAAEDRHFHLLISSAEDLDIELSRLDYIFIVPHPYLKLDKILAFFNKLKPRLLLVSSIDLYDEATGDKKWLKSQETQIAREAKEGNLNARIVRLGAIFGPRMDFEGSDPMIRLIQQTLNGELQKDISLEFSSRALYIEDAVNLIIKCIFAGATAQKIFDGVLPTPIKVAEIKQILLDPVWYENKNFTPQELPPWPTPNLEKTIKFLNWHPKEQIITNLRETLAYFKDNEIKVPKMEIKKSEGIEDKIGENNWKKEKEQQLEGLKGEQEKEKKGSRFMLFMAVLFIMYALVWPILQMGWGILTFRFQLLSAIQSLEKGQFEQSLFSVKLASDGVVQAKSIFYSLEPVRSTGVLKDQFEVGDNLVTLATLSTDAAQNTILGIQALYKSVKAITGEIGESPKSSFDRASIYLSSADQQLSKAEAMLKNEQFKDNMPTLIRARVEGLAERLSLYSALVKKARALSVLLPEVVAMGGNKSYLVLLQNNGQLRPTGGFIASFANITFEDGKLKKLEANDVYGIDGQLKIHVEPPKEIKSDLGQKDYYLRDANWEPDFPTAARQVEWFYTKETTDRVSGVVALDISAIEDLLKIMGPLELPDYNGKIDSNNLFEKSVSLSEVNILPGTQAKKSFLTALTTVLFNKLFFLPNQNWPGIVVSLGKSIESKHMSIYLDDPILFSYLVSQKWAAVMPRGSENNVSSDFLSVVEANLGENYANYYLDRKFNLETVIGKTGEINHRLRIAYTNRSPSETFPAGKYKNRMRIYLPFGTKLTRVLWGESEITKDVSSFVDYSRSGYSMLLELAPKEQKTLVIDYQPTLKLEFKDSKAIYRLDMVKQAGTLKDPFEWNVTYPINLKLVSGQAQRIGPQEQTIKTDLHTDKSFQLEFIR